MSSHYNIKFKGTSNTKLTTKGIALDDQPNIDDHMLLESQMYKITNKIFNLDQNGEITIELTPV